MRCKFVKSNKFKIQIQPQSSLATQTAELRQGCATAHWQPHSGVTCSAEPGPREVPPRAAGGAGGAAGGESRGAAAGATARILPNFGSILANLDLVHDGKC